jgi:hypothetical protein
LQLLKPPHSVIKRLRFPNLTGNTRFFKRVQSGEFFALFALVSRDGHRDDAAWLAGKLVVHLAS